MKIIVNFSSLVLTAERTKQCQVWKDAFHFCIPFPTNCYGYDLIVCICRNDEDDDDDDDDDDDAQICKACPK